MEKYKAKYCDTRGEENTIITNDGEFLRLSIRGVDFCGRAFDLFDPPSGTMDALKDHFSFYLDALCSYELDCDVPIIVIDDQKEIKGNLHIFVKLGEPDILRPHGMVRKKEDGEVIRDAPALGEEILRLTLEYAGKEYSSRGRNLYSSFNEQLTEIKVQLPDSVSVKTCWSCQYSDYHPVGSGNFGGLACFKNMKEEYCSVSGKRALMQMWEHRAAYVQEIYLCEEYDQRKAGVGGLYIG